MAKNIKIEVTSGCVHYGPDVHVAGDVFECEATEAARLIDLGVAIKSTGKPKPAQQTEPTPEQLAEKARTELLAAIAAAATPEDLTALMPEDEPDDELAEAFQIRMMELEQ